VVVIDSFWQHWQLGVQVVEVFLPVRSSEILFGLWIQPSAPVRAACWPTAAASTDSAASECTRTSTSSGNSGESFGTRDTAAQNEESEGHDSV